MNAQICLEKLKLCGVLSFATVDKNGAPQIRCISAIHYEPDSLYFFTARGKAFCDELLTDERVQILAYTRFKEMIRLSGKAVPLNSPILQMYTPVKPGISASFLSFGISPSNTSIWE